MDESAKLKSVLDKTRKEAEERDAERKAEKLGLPYINLAIQPVETDALECSRNKGKRSSSGGNRKERREDSFCGA